MKPSLKSLAPALALALLLAPAHARTPTDPAPAPLLTTVEQKLAEAPAGSRFGVLVTTLEGDPLLSQVPAVANGSIVNLPGTSPLGTAANPTPLSISWVLDDYLELLAAAADKAK